MGIVKKIIKTKKTNTMATLVKFVKETRDCNFIGEVTAVFPQLKYNKRLYGNTQVTGYAHIGQHTAINTRWIKESTAKATEAEYLPLLQELKSIGYTLKICKQ